MKRNALIRIILWSICLAILVSILFSVLVFRSVRLRRTEYVEYTSAPITAPTSKSYYTYSATEEVNVRDMPNADADVVGMLQAGQIVTVTEEIVVDQINWSHISAPVPGWVQTQYISVETAVAPMISNNHTDSIAFDADKVQSLEIEWVAGQIQILASETDEIRISECAVSNKRDTMVWKLRDGQLSIDFTEEDDRFLTFGNRSHFTKDLIIYLPADWVCNTLEIDAASADVEVEGITLRSVEFDGASGVCEFRNCDVRQLDIDTASGDIRFTGKLSSLDCDAASADILAVVENVPSRLDLDTMSGDLDITLPADAGFTLSLDTMSKDFSSEFDDVTVQNGEYIRGDGACRITVSAMSGDVMIRKSS